MALAREEVPELQGITEKTDGSLEGLEKLVADAGNSGVGGSDAALAITVYLFWLLVTFIGDPELTQTVGPSIRRAPGEPLKFGRRNRRE